jgi:hypothetical protein
MGEVLVHGKVGLEPILGRVNCLSADFFSSASAFSQQVMDESVCQP